VLAYMTFPARNMARRKLAASCNRSVLPKGKALNPLGRSIEGWELPAGARQRNNLATQLQGPAADDAGLAMPPAAPLQPWSESAMSWFSRPYLAPLPKGWRGHFLAQESRSCWPPGDLPFSGHGLAYQAAGEAAPA
jgi:hypothetical protein